METKDVFLLEMIVKYCDRIEESLTVFGDSFEAFDENIHFQDVCAFRVIQIGEYVNNLSDAFKNAHNQFPWHKIVGLRNLLTHDYGKVSNRQFWITIKEDIPPLRKFCAEQVTA